jgi:hypothetical protein
MKITQTIKSPDGTVKTVTRDDGNDPVKMTKVKQESKAAGKQDGYLEELMRKLGGGKVAQMGRRGGTQLAHVNSEEARKIAAEGRYGDNQLAYITPEKARELKMAGGSGTVNPATRLPEFYDTNSQKMKDDWNTWWKNPAGTQQDWLGGTLEMQPAMGSGSPTSLYTDASGKRFFFDQNAPFDVVAQHNPAIKQSWDTNYPDQPPPDDPQTTQTNLSDMFDFPLDIMPTSESSTNDISATNSYSGLPSNIQNELLAALMPQLKSAITNMPGNIDNYTNEALGSYQQMLQNSLRKDIPTALSNLANRGIINSTEGQNMLSKVMSDAAIGASDKGYQTAMQSALLKANMPTILGQLAELGKSTSSTSSSSGKQSSFESDPTVMYRQMADLIAQMMG